MNRSKKIILGIIAFVVAVLLIGEAFADKPLDTGPPQIPPGQEQTCEHTGDWTKDETAPFEYTAPDGYEIVEVCVKGGQDKKYYISNQDDGCWEVEGIGTGFAQVTKTGDGPTCKDISHASFRIEKELDEPDTPDTPTTLTTPTPPGQTQEVGGK